MTGNEALEILFGGVAGDRDAAAVALRKEIRASASSLAGSQSVAEREDIVHRVLLKLLERAALGAEPVGFGYVRAMVANAANDCGRRRARDERDAHALRVAADAASADVDAAPTADELLGRLDQALDRARADCPRDDVRADFDRAWSEVVALRLGDKTMDEVLEEHGAGADAPALDRKRALDTLQQRHKRARARVLAAIDALEIGATIDATQAAELRKITGALKRRQIRPGSNVPEAT